MTQSGAALMCKITKTCDARQVGTVVYNRKSGELELKEPKTIGNLRNTFLEHARRQIWCALPELTKSLTPLRNVSSRKAAWKAARHAEWAKTSGPRRLEELISSGKLKVFKKGELPEALRNYQLKTKDEKNKHKAFAEVDKAIKLAERRKLQLERGRVLHETHARDPTYKSLHPSGRAELSQKKRQALRDDLKARVSYIHDKANHKIVQDAKRKRALEIAQIRRHNPDLKESDLKDEGHPLFNQGHTIVARPHSSSTAAVATSMKYGPNMDKELHQTSRFGYSNSRYNDDMSD